MVQNDYLSLLSRPKFWFLSADRNVITPLSVMIVKGFKDLMDAT